MSRRQLVAEREPSLSQVVFPGEDLKFFGLVFGLSKDSIDHLVELVGLSWGLSNFGDDDVNIIFEVEVIKQAIRDELVWSFSSDADEAVLFRVVEPVSSLTSADHSVKLVYFYPNDLFNQMVAPLLKAFDSQFNCSVGHPQEYKTSWSLKALNALQAFDHFLIWYLFVR